MNSIIVQLLETLINFENIKREFTLQVSKKHEPKINESESFEVNQFGLINIIKGAFFSFSAFIILIFYGLNIISIPLIVGLIVLAFLSFKTGKTKKIVFEINTTGIFYFGKLITNWNNYKLSFYKREVSSSNGLGEDTFLNIQYYKDGISGFFIKKIKLDNIDKDENDIIDAIEFYYNASRKIPY